MRAQKIQLYLSSSKVCLSIWGSFGTVFRLCLCHSFSLIPIHWFCLNTYKLHINEFEVCFWRMAWNHGKKRIRRIEWMEIKTKELCSIISFSSLTKDNWRRKKNRMENGYGRRLGKCWEDGYDGFGIDCKSSEQWIFVIHIWYKLTKWNKLVGWMGFCSLFVVGWHAMDEYRTHNK